MDEDIQNDVDERGWTALSISDAQPPFVYTAGFSTTFKHPEAIVFGLQPPTASRLLADLVDGLRAGKRYDRPGVYTDETLAGPVGIRVVDESQHELYLGYAMGFCRRNGIDLNAVQVFWHDGDGRFPFDVGCDESTFALQPRLDVPLTPTEKAEYQWIDDL